MGTSPTPLKGLAGRERSRGGGGQSPTQLAEELVLKVGVTGRSGSLHCDSQAVHASECAVGWGEGGGGGGKDGKELEFCSLLGQSTLSVVLRILLF